MGYEDLPRSVRAEGAFLPWPLPSEVRLLSSTYRDLATAQEALGRLDAAAMRLPDPAGLVRFTRRREVRASAGLDGVITSAREALSAGLPGLATPTTDERLLRYVNTDDEGVAAMRARRPIDVSLLGQLSSTLTGSSPAGGVPWREQTGWLGGPDPQDAYLISAPPGADLRAATEQWCSWVATQREIPLVAKLALSHLQFAILAPFASSDHIGRLYFTLDLLQSKVLRDPVLPISPWLSRHRLEYPKHLRGVIDRGDLDAWMTFVATGIKTACQQQVQLIAKLEQVHAKMLRRFVRKDAIERLIDGLIGHPIANHAQIAELCGVTTGYATTMVRRLKAAGLLRNLNPKTLEHEPKDRANRKIVFCPDVVRLFGLHQPLPPDADLDALA